MRGDRGGITQGLSRDAQDDFIAASISERYGGSPIQFATKITTHLLWDVTGSFTCVVIFVARSYFSEILVRMRLSSKSTPTQE